MDLKIKDAELGLGPQCETVLRNLPEWFGIESALQAYVEKVNLLPTYIACTDNRAVGFLTLEKHFPESAEIHVMGIMPEFHRMGIGRALQRRAEFDLQAKGVKFLQVKTLSFSSSNKEYAETRKFYLAMGFSPLEEMPDLWGAGNPCLIMIKSLEVNHE